MSRGGAALATAHPPGFAHATAPMPASCDPIRLLRAFATNRRFLFQQPAVGTAIAGVGATIALRARGPRRFAELTAALADLTDGEPLPPGVVAVGGFAFDANARDAGPWRGFAALEWTVPQLTLVRRDGPASREFASKANPPTSRTGSRCPRARNEMVAPTPAIAVPVAGCWNRKRRFDGNARSRRSGSLDAGIGTATCANAGRCAAASAALPRPIRPPPPRAPPVPSPAGWRRLRGGVARRRRTRRTR